MEEKHCKWYNDEFCTNGDSPCVADYCPVVEYPELCKCREKDLVKEKSKEVNDLVKEEKELTDEEIVKALECCSGFGKCNDCPYTIKKIDCCQNHRGERDTLDLIHRLQGENKRLSLIAGMINKGVAVEIVNMQETIDMQKAEIGRLTEEKKTLVWLNQDLKKQVDELKAENTELYKEHTTLIAGSILEKQETAKEILQFVGNIVDDGDDRFKYKDYQWHKRLCERYGVCYEENN